MLRLATPIQSVTRPTGRSLPRDSFVRWLPESDGRLPPELLPAVDTTGNPLRLVLRHILRHSVFAEYDCGHCTRSYGRAMARYHH